ncbi:hypothetical protein F4820DRAFT_147461 [Hypoxylon rubiginosum]|uniref:Uncharacterized protein n=1 Tax=Hypoxylon rubiginosum TaxID=110542 RepID=A0ACB9ZGJ7_9PEZI|nr:hypothetical protein F4820DRAFT_147461 [Hypoxylon rubiginosum]
MRVGIVLSKLQRLHANYKTGRERERGNTFVLHDIDLLRFLFFFFRPRHNTASIFFSSCFFFFSFFILLSSLSKKYPISTYLDIISTSTIHLHRTVHSINNTWSPPRRVQSQSDIHYIQGGTCAATPRYSNTFKAYIVDNNISLPYSKRELKNIKPPFSLSLRNPPFASLSILLASSLPPFPTRNRLLTRDIVNTHVMLVCLYVCGPVYSALVEPPAKPLTFPVGQNTHSTHSQG